MGDGPNLMQKADAKIKGTFFGNFFSGGGQRKEEAAELYVQAANQFKLHKRWNEAAEAFMRASQCHQQLDNGSDAINLMVEAAKMMQRYSTADAVQYFNQAVDLYSNTGRFSQAAKLLKQIAETFEQEGNYEKCVDYYRRAAEMFEMDDYGKSSYSQCILKVAEHGARLGKLEDAIAIYEKEGEKALGNNLIQFGAKEHFLKAGILHLASGDAINAKIASEKYERLDPRFAPSREGALLKSLVAAFEQQNAQQFTDAIAEYDRLSPLDQWKTHFLYKVKQSMAPTSDGGAADLT